MEFKTDERQMEVFAIECIRREPVEIFRSGFFLKDAYVLYKRWCLHRNVVESQMGKNRFGAYLEIIGFERQDRVDNVRYRGGVLIQNDEYPRWSLRDEQRKVRTERKVRKAERLARKAEFLANETPEEKAKRRDSLILMELRKRGLRESDKEVSE